MSYIHFMKRRSCGKIDCQNNSMCNEVANVQDTYIVTQEYENSNADPIVLEEGDMVRLGQRSDDNGPWANWIYCLSGRTGKTGWTPVQILQIDGETGIATTDYTAKEMTVVVGDIVCGNQDLNGWLWCVRESDGESGWVPKNCLSHTK